MRSTEELRNEHEGVGLMLKILVAATAKMEKGERVAKEDLEGMGEFLTVFVDKCHHGKEEDILFPAMEAAGVPREGGPIGVMLAEHAEGRRLVKLLKGVFEECGAGGEGAAKKAGEVAREYADLMDGHIEKENNVLYPMGERLISEKKDGEMMEAFEKLEEERIGAGRHEAFHAMMGKMEKKYLNGQ